MKKERWEMKLNHATGRYEIGTPDAIPYCQFAEVNSEARAKLMLAAPDLLAALKKSIEIMETEPGCKFYSAHIQGFRSVIERAENNGH